MAILIGRALKMQLQKGKQKMFTPNAPIVSGTLGSGQTGTLLSVPEVDGIVYKITFIASVSSSGAIPNTSLIIDGAVISSGNLLGSSTSGGVATQNTYAVSNRFSLPNAIDSGVRYYREIYCKSFSLNASTATGLGIDYAYEIGSFK